MLIEWTKEFEICDKIDSQHKRLIELINHFYEAYIFSSSAKKSVQEIIEELSIFASYHFRTEEALFREHDFILKGKHLNEHRDFENEIKKFSERFNSNDMSLSNDIIIFLKDWVNFHLLDTDKKNIRIICK